MRAAGRNATASADHEARIAAAQSFRAAAERFHAEQRAEMERLREAFEAKHAGLRERHQAAIEAERANWTAAKAAAREACAAENGTARAACMRAALADDLKAINERLKALRAELRLEHQEAVREAKALVKKFHQESMAKFRAAMRAHGADVPETPFAEVSEKRHDEAPEDAALELLAAALEGGPEAPNEEAAEAHASNATHADTGASA